MSIPSWCRVGARVVCVDDSDHPIIGDKLVNGHVYTVVGVVDWWGICCFLLAEAKSDHGTGSYRARRFRPVKTIEDDISEHFAILLSTPAPQPVEMAS